MANVMKNLKMFCLTMESNHLDIIKKFNYIPVGLKGIILCGLF